MNKTQLTLYNYFIKIRKYFYFLKFKRRIKKETTKTERKISTIQNYITMILKFKKVITLRFFFSILVKQY